MDDDVRLICMISKHRYSPNLTLKNWLSGLPGGTTSIVVLTALFFSVTVTPLDIGEAVLSPSSVSAAYTLICTFYTVTKPTTTPSVSP